jgi:hypothetical protein
MKSSEFKQMIKESVKEAIHEELKDILLEALKSSQNSNTKIVKESQNFTPNPMISPNKTTNPRDITLEQKKALYEQALGDTTLSFNSKNVQSFSPQQGYDPTNGALPQGNVDMGQIMSLMGKK